MGDIRDYSFGFGHCFIFQLLIWKNLNPMNEIERAKNILTFFKEAFIVDGEVRFATAEENKKCSCNQWIRFEDSKRGVFYVGVFNEKKS